MGTIFTVTLEHRFQLSKEYGLEDLSKQPELKSAEEIRLETNRTEHARPRISKTDMCNRSAGENRGHVEAMVSERPSKLISNHKL